MFQFISVALLVIFDLGNARTVQYSRGISESRNDETFRAAYEEAVSDFPELVMNHSTAGNAQYCENYGADQIRAILYSRSNPYGIEAMKDTDYDITKSFKIIVQQQKFDSVSKYRYTDLITAYLRHYNESVNVINVHYPKFFGCDVDQYVRIYDLVTETISQWVTFLQDKGTSPERIHIIGLGFSAHIAGSMAKMLKPLKIGRITGLDPLGGAFDRSTFLGRLDADDANFVDVITTNSRHFGTKKMRGSVQFYPNGGEIQLDSDDFDSHLKAKDYFVESIVRAYSFKSAKAQSWNEYNYGVTVEDSTYMGEYASNNSVPGKYFLEINSVSPFSKVGEDNLNQRDRDAYPPGSLFEKVQKALNSVEVAQRAEQNLTSRLNICPNKADQIECS